MVVHDVTGSLHYAKAAIWNERYPKVSVLPRVGSFGAPYKHNNNAKQAHFWKLQLQNFTTCLICIRRVKIPSFGSCHVFLISADWSWSSEFCEANNFVVTCCKCLGHAAAPLKLESNYSSCSPGHFPLRHNCLWFMIGRVTWEKPFMEWNLFLLCWIATNAFHTQSCKFPRLRTKEWGTIEFKAIAPLNPLSFSIQRHACAQDSFFSQCIMVSLRGSVKNGTANAPNSVGAMM